MSSRQLLAKLAKAMIPRRLGGLMVALVFSAGTKCLPAQSLSRLDLGGALETGGEAERYARALQLAGLTAVQPWSIQPFSPTQARSALSLAVGPWRRQAETAADTGASRSLRMAARLVANSTRPVQVGNGPAWSGRGLTLSLQGGYAMHRGNVYGQLAPVAFVAENAAFDLAPNGETGRLAFGNAQFPRNIDAPQRFGNGVYAGLAPGSSSIIFDGARMVAGLSSAPNRWGPAREYPLVLGPSAGGFPAAFIGTGSPVPLWVAKLHARLIYGELGQSRFSAVDSGETRRFGSGLVLVAEPRGVPGLEFGAARFLHRCWCDLTLGALQRPFSGIIGGTDRTRNTANENQTGSVFARWFIPAAKAEFYGEMYREDYPGKFRQETSSLIELPEDYTAFSLGFQHALHADSSKIRVLRGELVNAQTSHVGALERGFTVPSPIYVHSAVVQGHTLNGLFLGAPEAFGGGGWKIGLDEYTPSGRRSIGLERTLRFDWIGSLPDSKGIHPSVDYAARFEMLSFRGHRDLTLTVLPGLVLNNNLQAGHDSPNLTVAITLGGWP
jgi:hypothetical protein